MLFLVSVEVKIVGFVVMLMMFFLLISFCNLFDLICLWERLLS